MVQKKTVAMVLITLCILLMSERIIDSILMFLLGGIIPGTKIALSATGALLFFGLPLVGGIGYPFRRRIARGIDIFVQHTPSEKPVPTPNRCRYRQAS